MFFSRIHWFYNEEGAHNARVTITAVGEALGAVALQFPLWSAKGSALRSHRTFLGELIGDIRFGFAKILVRVLSLFL